MIKTGRGDLILAQGRRNDSRVRTIKSMETIELELQTVIRTMELDINSLKLTERQDNCHSCVSERLDLDSMGKIPTLL
jgi:hypothetical protein